MWQLHDGRRSRRSGIGGMCPALLRELQRRMLHARCTQRRGESLCRHVADGGRGCVDDGRFVASPTRRQRCWYGSQKPQTVSLNAPSHGLAFVFRKMLHQHKVVVTVVCVRSHTRARVVLIACLRQFHQVKLVLLSPQTQQWRCLCRCSVLRGTGILQLFRRKLVDSQPHKRCNEQSFFLHTFPEGSTCAHCTLEGSGRW